MMRNVVGLSLLFLLMTTYCLAAEEAATQQKAIQAQGVLPSSPASAVQVPAGSAQVPPQGMMMVCPMMGGMGGGMMGMGGGMSGGASAMSHNMSQGLGMKDIMQIMTMQDTLQIVADMLKIQEQLAEETKGARSSRLKRDIQDLRERAKQAVTDLKSFVAEQSR